MSANENLGEKMKYRGSKIVQLRLPVLYCTCADKREILKTLAFFVARIAAY